jgi:homoserine O-acetyltransferase
MVMVLLQDEVIPTVGHLAYEGHQRQPGSVGIVQRHDAHFDQSLHLRGGGVLDGFTLAYETYGTLNADQSNAILICHALSGDSHVAGYYAESDRPGWWDEAVGPGKMFDTDRYFVICSNVIGGCQGSTGPSSLAPDGKPYGMRFPVITVADMVAAQSHLLDYLGIRRLFSVAGGSMGGMQALQWALDYPDRVDSVLFLASTPRSSAQNIAFNEIGRQAIFADPNWNGGDYYDGTFPAAGLAVARMIGHITYMSETSLENKFGRRTQNGGGLAYSFDTDFAIESYLKHQGEKFVERFDANSYLYITKALDYYDATETYDSLADSVSRICCPFLVVSISSDWLYTAGQALELVSALEAAGKAVDYHHINATFGHDSFLVEVEAMTEIVGGYLSRRWQQRPTGITDQCPPDTLDHSLSTGASAIVANIKIPTPLRVYTNNQAQVAVKGTTVGEALNDLTDQYPELRQHLFNGAELRNFVNVFLDEEDVRFLDGLNTEIDATTNLRIIPSIAGGAQG